MLAMSAGLIVLGQATCGAIVGIYIFTMVVIDIWQQQYLSPSDNNGNKKLGDEFIIIRIEASNTKNKVVSNRKQKAVKE